MMTFKNVKKLLSDYGDILLCAVLLAYMAALLLCVALPVREQRLQLEKSVPAAARELVELEQFARSHQDYAEDLARRRQEVERAEAMLAGDEQSRLRCLAELSAAEGVQLLEVRFPEAGKDTVAQSNVAVKRLGKAAALSGKLVTKSVRLQLRGGFCSVLRWLEGAEQHGVFVDRLRINKVDEHFNNAQDMRMDAVLEVEAQAQLYSLRKQH